MHLKYWGPKTVAEEFRDKLARNVNKNFKKDSYNCSEKILKRKLYLLSPNNMKP